jgi:hypothetical protein
MNKKLKLNKEVIAQLTDDSMNRVHGGGENRTYTDTCTCYAPACTDTAKCTDSCNHCAIPSVVGPGGGYTK